MCDESGMSAALKKALWHKVLAKEVRVLTSAVASPTGFPFKVADLEGTLSDQNVYSARGRLCDSGFLRDLYSKADGSVGYRCPAEPIDDYVKKGGLAADAVNRICLCNGLATTAGFTHRRKDGYVEPAIITGGDDLVTVAQFVRPGADSYSARDVVNSLLGPSPGNTGRVG